MLNKQLRTADKGYATALGWQSIVITSSLGILQLVMKDNQRKT